MPSLGKKFGRVLTLTLRFTATTPRMDKKQSNRKYFCLDQDARYQ